MPPQPSSSRALAAILPQIEAGFAYEAHQKARTFASRYVKANQRAVAAEVLFESARALLKAGQQGSGTDLTVFLIEVWEGADLGVNDDTRGKLTQLIALVGPGGSWRKTILDRSISWSSKAGDYPCGDPQILHYAGELLHKEGSYPEAEPYLLTAGKRDSARLLATVFTDWAAATGTSQDLGPFALRGVIPYLEASNVLAARAFVTALRPPNAITTTVGETGDDIWSLPGTTDRPLIFAQLAVLLCQRGRPARESWQRLYGTYQARGELIANPEVRKSILNLSSIYFGVAPPRAAGNPFGDILSGLFGGPPAAAGNARASAGRIVDRSPGLD
ncbi:hypothetical protein BKA62DRAFT_693917 [Auriculariales sp. MPI-PUGE-AT-0066]|nr:hypothetical protein BKA62DRAFT_693917 [Auriculariales sp. MPI-PUGE-AT-0066]